MSLFRIIQNSIGQPRQYFLEDNGVFPNSRLPVLHYEGMLTLPFVFPARAVTKMFQKNNWKNNWTQGIYTFHHYHSVTHEALCICKGKTVIQLGGENGVRITVGPGDVIIIPAGVAHRNIGSENDVVCVGGYPGGKEYDMNYGKAGERPQTDSNIAEVPLPDTDPVSGKNGLTEIWAKWIDRS